MKYKLNIENNKGLLKNKINNNGYKLPSKNKYFIIQESKICNIIIINKKLAHPFIYKVVRKKYTKLIGFITDLLTSEDDTGVSCRETLNQIERFKAEVKGKYRIYLQKQELKEMSTNLKILQKQAKLKEIEIYENQITFSQKRTR